jgi:hypothetical protein
MTRSAIDLIVHVSRSNGAGGGGGTLSTTQLENKRSWRLSREVNCREAHKFYGSFTKRRCVSFLVRGCKLQEERIRPHGSVLWDLWQTREGEEASRHYVTYQHCRHFPGGTLQFVPLILVLYRHFD